MPVWLEQARRIIDDSCTESLRVDVLARKVGVHPVHLNRMFQRRLGLSAKADIHRARNVAAARLLADSSIPVCDVAAEVGLCDQSHLNRVFKRSTGITPARFRELVSGEAS